MLKKIQNFYVHYYLLRFDNGEKCLILLMAVQLRHSHSIIIIIKYFYLQYRLDKSYCIYIKHIWLTVVVKNFEAVKVEKLPSSSNIFINMNKSCPTTTQCLIHHALYVSFLSPLIDSIFAHILRAGPSFMDIADIR